MSLTQEKCNASEEGETEDEEYSSNATPGPGYYEPNQLMKADFRPRKGEVKGVFINK